MTESSDSAETGPPASGNAGASSADQPAVVCLGEPMLELNQQADGRYLAGFGGDTSNCAIAAARQGASVAYLTRIGRDAFGDQFMQLWTREGIDTRGVVATDEGHTGVYFVTHSHAGHAFSYLRSGSAASRMTPATLRLDVIRNARVLHVSGISMGISDTAADTVLAAIQTARAAGVAVSVDPNYRPRLWALPRARALIHAAMSQADIALPGLDDAQTLTGLDAPEAIADFYLSLGAQVVALTLGEQGVLVATGQRRERIAGHAVKAVDATGAGDTFDGAFLAQWLVSGDAFNAARHANAAAALATTGFGAVTPIPDRQTVLDWMAATARHP